ELELDVESRVLLGDLDRNHPLAREPAVDLLARGEVDLAGLDGAGRGASGVGERRHRSDTSGRNGFSYHAQQLVRVARPLQALLQLHLALDVELVERVVEGLHPVLLPGLHDRVDLMHLVVPDAGTDGGGADEDLAGADSPAALPR